jgi:hypothetical protein
MSSKDEREAIIRGIQNTVGAEHAATINGNNDGRLGTEAAANQLVDEFIETIADDGAEDEWLDENEGDVIPEVPDFTDNLEENRKRLRKWLEEIHENLASKLLIVEENIMGKSKKGNNESDNDDGDGDGSGDENTMVGSGLLPHRAVRDRVRFFDELI